MFGCSFFFLCFLICEFSSHEQTQNDIRRRFVFPWNSIDRAHRSSFSLNLCQRAYVCRFVAPVNSSYFALFWPFCVNKNILLFRIWLLTRHKLCQLFRFVVVSSFDIRFIFRFVLKFLFHFLPSFRDSEAKERHEWTCGQVFNMIYYLFLHGLCATDSTRIKPFASRHIWFGECAKVDSNFTSFDKRSVSEGKTCERKTSPCNDFAVFPSFFFVCELVFGARIRRASVCDTNSYRSERNNQRSNQVARDK